MFFLNFIIKYFFIKATDLQIDQDKSVAKKSQRKSYMRHPTKLHLGLPRGKILYKRSLRANAHGDLIKTNFNASNCTDRITSRVLYRAFIQKIYIGMFIHHSGIGRNGDSVCSETVIGNAIGSEFISEFIIRSVRRSDLIISRSAHSKKTNTHCV